MVEIKHYCARIGTFTLEQYLKSKYNLRALGSNNRLREDSNFLFITLFSIMVLFSLFGLVTVANLETFNNFKTMALKLSGDVELNPELYEIIRSVQGSFS